MGMDDAGATTWLQVERLGLELGMMMGASELHVDVLWGNEGVLDGGEVVVLAAGVIFSVPGSCTAFGTFCWSLEPPMSEAVACLRSMPASERWWVFWVLTWDPSKSSAVSCCSPAQHAAWSTVDGG
jgi:hypothetical protein